MLNKYYYIAYNVVIKNEIIHGSGTFECKGKPDLEMWIENIKCLTESKGKQVFAVQVLSCIEVKKDFIK